MNLGYSLSVMIRKKTNKDQNIRIDPLLRVAWSSHVQGVSETVRETVAHMFQRNCIPHHV